MLGQPALCGDAELNRRSRFIGRAVEVPAHVEICLGQTGSNRSQSGHFQWSKISRLSPALRARSPTGPPPTGESPQGTIQNHELTTDRAEVHYSQA